MMASPAKTLSPQAARALAAREAKLAEMAEQVSNGSLVVRQMTAAERKRFARSGSPRPSKPRGRAR